MSNLLGANWVSTVWGVIFALAVAITTTPAVIEFLPDGIEPTIKGICGLIVAVAGVGLAVSVKSRNVTGGTVQQTAGGAEASAGTQTLVDETIKASIKSGEAVTPEQHRAATS